jgi:DNA-binding response OmpR family regulator
MYDDVYDRSIGVQMLRLRRKIEKNAAEPRLIKTARAGYSLDGVEAARGMRSERRGMSG